MRIAVLCGGLSPERDVSLSTGAMVAAALRSGEHQVAVVDSAADYDDDIMSYFSSAPVENADGAIADVAPDIDALRRSRKSFFGKNVIGICQAADIVFNALHGEEGEDGRLQAAFDMLGIRYTGSGAKGSMLAMDKLLTKQILSLVPQAVRIPRGAVVRRERFGVEGLPSGLEVLGMPLVVKPVSGGSSVGVSIVKSEDELITALQLAFRYEDRVLIEEYIEGREFSVGVVGDLVLPAIEIRPKHGFYDYRNKYQKGLTDEICPADIDKETSVRMQRMAGITYTALSLSAYARIDFIMTNKGVIYCLEANTLPGMTPVSLLPQEAAAAGMSFEALCERIIAESIKLERK